MIFKKPKSILNKVLDSYNSLFETWKKESFNSDTIDEILYTKDNIKIVFQEDLREHITNLSITHPQKRIGKICYRELVLDKELLGIDKIKNSLLSLGNKNNCEKQEVEIYIEFLKLNKIL